MFDYEIGTEIDNMTTMTNGAGTWLDADDYKVIPAIDPYEWKKISDSVSRIIEPKKGDDDMRYLYEVILVSPKNDKFVKSEVVAKSETSAIMKTYNASQFNASQFNVDDVPFDDLKTSCRILMEWKKEKSLKKAIETIKKAVE